MGFSPPKRTAKIRGADDYAGLEATVSLSQSLADSLEFTEAMESGDAGRIVATIRQFGETALLEWNVEDDDGQPVPATGEGMLTQDMSFATAIIGAWMEALVAPPLTPSGTPEPGAPPASETAQPNGAPTDSSINSASAMEALRA